MQPTAKESYFGVEVSSPSALRAGNCEGVVPHQEDAPRKELDGSARAVVAKEAHHPNDQAVRDQMVSRPNACEQPGCFQLI